MTAKTPENFESAIAHLEKIVKEMEHDEITLEDALNKYQDGAALVKYCQDKLSEVEQQIKIFDADTDSLKDFNL